MLDARTVETTVHLEKIRNPKILHPTSPYIDLQLGTSAEFNNEGNTSLATGCKIPINCPSDGGVFVVDFTVLVDTTAISNFNLVWYPNNVNVGSAQEVTFIGYNKSGELVCEFLNGSNILANPNVDGTDSGPDIYGRVILSTFINQKQWIAYIMDTNGLSFGSNVWNDTTTKWTKLGTICFPNVSNRNAKCTISGIVTRVL